MKIKTLLAIAKSCKTDEDTENLLQTLMGAFSKAKLLSHLSTHNEQSYLENGTPFVSFEFNHEINGNYVTMIRPEIRDSKLVIVVVTNHMKDGMGIYSKSWEVASGTDEEVIETEPNDTVAMLAQRASTLAIRNHSELITCVGVSTEIANIAAQKSWNS